MAKKLGNYELREEIGRGGMATVYIAYDTNLEREVALKILPTYFAHEPEFSARFEREAKTISALEHAAIVPIYDFGEHDMIPYLVMRLMTGGSLGHRLKKGAISVKESAIILARICMALDKAHGRGIIHRDLKPDNILFDEDGEAFLADFGIVKLAEGSTTFTQTGSTLGTPAYMSPEQVRGLKDVDHRTDIYALGVVLYQMLTADLPYKAETDMGMAMMHVMEPVPEILEKKPDLPIAIDGVIKKAMAKDREDRYESAGALAHALRAVAAGGARPAPAASPPQTEVIQPPPLSAEPRLIPAARPPHYPPTMVDAPPKRAKPTPAWPEDQQTIADTPAPLAPPDGAQWATPAARSATPTGPSPEHAQKGRPKWLIPVIALVAFGVIAAAVVTAIGGALLLSGGNGGSDNSIGDSGRDGGAGIGGVNDADEAGGNENDDNVISVAPTRTPTTVPPTRTPTQIRPTQAPTAPSTSGSDAAGPEIITISSSLGNNNEITRPWNGVLPGQEMPIFCTNLNEERAWWLPDEATYVIEYSGNDDTLWFDFEAEPDLVMVVFTPGGDSWCVDDYEDLSPRVGLPVYDQGDYVVVVGHLTDNDLGSSFRGEFTVCANACRSLPEVSSDTMVAGDAPREINYNGPLEDPSRYTVEAVEGECTGTFQYVGFVEIRSNSASFYYFDNNEVDTIMYVETSPHYMVSCNDDYDGWNPAVFIPDRPGVFYIYLGYLFEEDTGLPLDGVLVIDPGS